MWILYGLLAAATAAAMTIVAKIGLKQVDPTLATAIRSGFMFGFTIIFVFVTGKAKNLSSLQAKDFGIIALAGLFGALSWLFYFLGLKATSASKLASLDRLSLPLIILCSVLILAEPFSWKLALGGLLVTGGAILIAVS